jgi:DNA-binding LacI/PurR family transcriptional regulator
MSVSITKVAEVAGVSHATVSRVINKNPCVSPTTVQIVQAAIDQLGYFPPNRRPGPKLGSRRQEKKMRVAFFVFASSKKDPPPAFQKMLAGVSNALGGHSADMLFQVSDDDSILDLLRSNRIDGLLAHGQMPSPAIQQELATLPTVWLMANQEHPTWGDQVMPNHLAIGQSAAKYLIDHGRRDLAFLNLWGKHLALRMHNHAFVNAAEAMGAKVHSVTKAESGPPTFWGQHAADLTESLIDDLLALSPTPRGLFISDDLQASVIQPVMIRRGLKIGDGDDEFSVISCNNEQSFLAGLQPRPATIDFHPDTVGKRAVDQLIWRINAQRSGEACNRMCTLVEPSLVLPNGAPLNHKSVC